MYKTGDNVGINASLGSNSNVNIFFRQGITVYLNMIISPHNQIRDLMKEEVMSQNVEK